MTFVTKTILLAVSLANISRSAALVGVTNLDGDRSGFAAEIPKAVPFAITYRQTDVDIGSVFLQGSVPVVDAYLTNRVGPGTTIDNVFAYREFSLTAQPGYSPYTIFQGLVLAPGYYYLILTTPFPVGSDYSGYVSWATGTSFIQTPGQAQVGGSLNVYSTDPFTPASGFYPPRPVSGTTNAQPSFIVSTPEPSTYGFMATALFALLVFAKGKVTR